MTPKDKQILKKLIDFLKSLQWCLEKEFEIIWNGFKAILAKNKILYNNWKKVIFIKID